MSIQVDLSGQAVVVTGAGRGIGRAIALALAKNGATVVASARTQSQIEETVRTISQAGGKSAAYRCDIADESQINHMFEFAMDQFGRIDILVNNAGIGLFGALHNFSTADLDKLLAVNMRGTYICCREALQRMIPCRSGWIINISSVVGFKGYPNQSAYTASKHAIVGLTKSLAVEAQEYNIRVSMIHPGGVDTDLVGDARPDLDRSILLQPEDIAEAVLYLLNLSDRCTVDELYIRRRSSQPF